MLAIVFTTVVTIFATSSVCLAIAQYIVRRKTKKFEGQLRAATNVLQNLRKAKKVSDAEYESQIKTHMEDKAKLLAQIQRKLKWGDENEYHAKIDELTKKLAESRADLDGCRKELIYATQEIDQYVADVEFWKKKAVEATKWNPEYPPQGPNPLQK